MPDGYEAGDVEWVEDTGEVFVHAYAFCVKCGDRSVRFMTDHLDDGDPPTWTCAPAVADG